MLNDQYDIAYEVLKRFFSDMLKAKELPIFETLFMQMENSKRYEAKIAVALVALPLMKRKMAFKLMKMLLGLLEAPAQDSILRNNINPLRVGLMLYRLI